jgi:hypothetical protein
MNFDPRYFQQPTYSCVTANFTPAATPTDLFKITGAANKVIRILELYFGGTATALAIIDLFLAKRSADNTTGTFVAGTKVPHDSGFKPADAVVGHYTANPGGLGALVGNVSHKKICLPIATSPVTDIITKLDRNVIQLLEAPIVLRSAAEILAINFNGAALPAGAANWFAGCTWIEEPA